MNPRTLAFRIAAGLSSLLLVLSIAYMPVAQKSAPRAEALFGGSIVFDPANWGVNLSQEIIMKSLNGIAWNVAKMAIQSLTRSMVNWINSGFEGSPGYVTNLKDDLQNVGDLAARQFLYDLTEDGRINSPFSEEVTAAIAAGYYLSTNPEGFAQTMRYTLSQFSLNDESFLDGDFSQGGLNAWRAASMDCGNNPYCSYLATQAQLQRRAQSAISERLTQLGWGNGFLSWGQCVQEGPPPREGGTPVAGGDTCVKRKTTTPGSLIENQLVTVFGSPIRQLELADSVNEIVSALMVQMVSQAFGGAGGLLGLSQASAGGGGSPINTGTDPSQYTGGDPSTPGAQISGIVNNLLAQLPVYQQNWDTVFIAANSARATLSELATCQRQNRNAAFSQTQQLMTSQVDPVLERSGEGQALARSALTSLQSLRSRVTSAGGNATQLASIAAEYDQLVRAGAIPTQAQFGEAAVAASENPAAGMSDYLRMTALAEEAADDLEACE